MIDKNNDIPKIKDLNELTVDEVNELLQNCFELSAQVLKTENIIYILGEMFYKFLAGEITKEDYKRTIDSILPKMQKIILTHKYFNKSYIEKIKNDQTEIDDTDTFEIKGDYNGGSGWLN